MIIGVPKETKNNENRVGMIPTGVTELVKKGYTVHIQVTTGVNSGFFDDDYIAVGVQILPVIEDIYVIADMIAKVKEPIAPEYKLIEEGQVVSTYFHFVVDKVLTEVMIESGAVCIAYETVEKEDHSLPLLTPMNEVIGYMATQVSARFLGKPQGGEGKLMGGVPGICPARVLILGGGIVDTNAAQTTAGMGAEIVITDVNLPRLRYLGEVLPRNIKALYSSFHNTKMELLTVDLVVDSVLIPGDKAPRLITRGMLRMVKPGTALADVAIDQSGCFETPHPTTHSELTYTASGIMHYTVASIPGAAPFTSTTVLANVILPYTVALACKGWEQVCEDDSTLALGLNVVEEKVTYKAVADIFGMKYGETKV